MNNINFKFNVMPTLDGSTRPAIGSVSSFWGPISTSGVSYPGVLAIRQYGGSNNSYYDEYQLPTNASLSTNTIRYIYTSKNLVADETNTLYIVGRLTNSDSGLKYSSKAQIVAGKLSLTATWNDYAERRRIAGAAKAGQCVCENGDGTLSVSSDRMMPGGNVISDTYGMLIGENIGENEPIAVSGRVLAYPFEDKKMFKPGDAVCSGPNGTVSIMTREEITQYPERIVGTVSEIPTYEVWGDQDIDVDGRIWIKVK